MAAALVFLPAVLQALAARGEKKAAERERKPATKAA
jgi:hypothetical protein